MTRQIPRKVKPGDVFELTIAGEGVALQAIAKHRSHGWAVRVTEPGPTRLNADGIDAERELYVILIGDLAFEETERHLRYVGRATLPQRYRDGLPIFRASASYRADGRHEDGSWWLDDGRRVWYVGELSASEKHYPYRQLTPALALKELIEHGWDPEWEFKGPGARKFATPPPVRNSTEDGPVFFLVFDSELSAREASDQIGSSRMFTSVTVDAIGDNAGRYVVEVQAPKSVDFGRAEMLLERLARRHHGEYDGNECPVR